MPSKVWDEITYLFPNFNGCTVEVGEWISNFVPDLVRDQSHFCHSASEAILLSMGKIQHRNSINASGITTTKQSKTQLHWKRSVIILTEFSSLTAPKVVKTRIFGAASNGNFIEMMTFHDDVIKWKRFPYYWPFVRGIHRSPVNSPHKGQWREALIFSLICAWINGWVNNRESGDLRRHRAHYDVTVMYASLWVYVVPIYEYM